MKYFIAIIFFLIIDVSYAQDFKNEISIIQKDTTFILSKENSEISLQKKPFSIQFHSKFDNAKKDQFNGLKVTVVKNNFNLAAVEEGIPISLIPFFEDMVALPTQDFGFYTSVLVGNYNHHYLFYEEETKRNIRLISRKNDTGFFEWEISKFYIEDTETAIESLSENKLIFIFLNDYNSNELIDADELHIVNVVFK